MARSRQEAAASTSSSRRPLQAAAHRSRCGWSATPATIARHSATSATPCWTSRTGAPPDLYLHVGDIAYNNGTDAEWTNNHFAQYVEIQRNTVFWPSIGNHDSFVSGFDPGSGTGKGPYFDAHVPPHQRGGRRQRFGDRVLLLLRLRQCALRRAELSRLPTRPVVRTCSPGSRRTSRRRHRTG